MAGLRGKVVIVTGASSGIGAGTAKRLAGHGAKLVLAGRNEANLAATASACLAAGAQADHVLSVPGDMTKTEDRERLVNVVLDHFGGIDVLINSAGAIISGPVEAAPMTDLDWIMDVNTRAVVGLTKLAIPHLKKTKGAIVNVSSVTGTCAFPGVAYYCMSKAALDHFTKCLALELAPDGVRVNSVNPGVILTELHRRGGMDETAYQAFIEKAKTTHALGRPGNVDEVAAAIEFLASEAASFTTGHLFPVDGGRSIITPR